MSEASEPRGDAAERPEARGSRASKTVLFITYYYPPSGGPGVQRALKFSRYLSQNGWTPVVITVRPEDAAFPARDDSLLEEVPPGLAVLRTRSWDPYAAYAAFTGKKRDESIGVGFIGESEPDWKERIGRWLRANLFLPDARVGWVPYAVAACRRLLREGLVDAVFTSGPPHSTHLAGLWISRRHGLPWLADFRDPWTDIDYYTLLPATGLARRFERFLERKVLSSADVVTVVGPDMGEMLSRHVQREYQVIYNGFDPADFSVSAAVSHHEFVIAHVGSMTASANPTALWQALAEPGVADAMPELAVRLVGNVDPAVHAEVVRRGLDRFVKYVAYRPHADAVEEMKKAAVLLLAIGRMPGAEGIVTGKLFEYIAAARPVLGVGPVAGNAARVIRHARAGEMYCHDCRSEIVASLRKHYESWKRGTPLDGAAPERVAEFSRPHQARQLAECLDAAVTARMKRSGGVDGK